MNDTNKSIKETFSPVSNMQFEPGRLVGGRYEIVSELGKGGMAVVYRVKQIFLQREFALKTIDKTHISDTTVRRFQQEARAAFSLDHPNIIGVKDFGILEDETPFLVMDLIIGETLSDFLKRNVNLSVEDAVKIFAQICFGLAYAHQCGIVHRDIKPSNIMIVKSLPLGVEGSVKILDFGIARIVGHEAGEIQALTRTGEIFGSPLYMSPEQCSGSRVDSRADVYSLGCVLFEALTGTPPFVCDNALSTMMKHQVENPPSLKEASLGLVFPPALEQIVSKMLAKSPAARYDDLGKAALELNAVVRGEPLPSTSNKPATASKATTWIQLHKSKVQLVVFVATVALVSFIIGLAVNKPTTSQSREAVAPTEQKAEIASVLPEDNLEDSYEIDLLSHPTKDARLKYEMVPVGKKLMEKISETKWIHQLILNNCQIDNQSVHYLASLDLEHLELDGSALDEVGAAGLTNCHALKNIELKNVTVTAAVLKSLSKLKNIEVLNLTGATLEGDCLLPISRMVNLRRLDLTGVRSIKAGSLKYFERLNHLHEFDLNRTNVAKQGLLSFCRQNKSCKVIFLHDCPLVKKADTQTLRDEFRTVQFLTE